MARYSYLAIDAEGRERQGGIDAPTEQAARSALSAKKLLPVEITVGERAAERRAATQTSAKPRGVLRHRDLVLVTRQLATLVGAAVPVDEALGILAQQQENAVVRRVMADVRAGVQEGSRLADALGRHKASFPGAYRAAVAGGERAGNLAPVFNRLANHLAREHSLRSKISTAMIYPAALLTVATVVVSCLMIFVVPSLIEQFRTFRGELPFITNVLIAVSNILTQFWPFLLAGLVGAILFVRMALMQPGIRFGLDSALLRAPVIGKWVRAVNASRFVRAVSTMAASGLPMLDCVRAAKESVSNRKVSKAIGEMADRIEEGEPLSHAMRQSGVIPPMVVYMAVGGENSSELPDMLEKAADHIDQDFESFIQAALSLIEPAIIVLMGAVVAGIVLAIMLPILQLNQLATG
jgi:general secretion pathway protein F